MDQQFACGNGHTVIAWLEDGLPADLTGYLCMVCMGRVIGHGDMIDSHILAPVQAANAVAGCD
jgi:hypothetical protein